MTDYADIQWDDTQNVTQSVFRPIALVLFKTFFGFLIILTSNTELVYV